MSQKSAFEDINRPNIVIVPTMSFCNNNPAAPAKKLKLDSIPMPSKPPLPPPVENVELNDIPVPPPPLPSTVKPNPQSEHVCESAKLEIKPERVQEDSKELQTPSECKPEESLCVETKTTTNKSWASNYMKSIGQCLIKPIKLNLSAKTLLKKSSTEKLAPQEDQKSEIISKKEDEKSDVGALSMPCTDSSKINTSCTIDSKVNTVQKTNSSEGIKQNTIYNKIQPIGNINCGLNENFTNTNGINHNYSKETIYNLPKNNTVLMHENPIKTCTLECCSTVVNHTHTNYISESNSSVPHQPLQHINYPNIQSACCLPVHGYNYVDYNPYSINSMDPYKPHGWYPHHSTIEKTYLDKKIDDFLAKVSKNTDLDDSRYPLERARYYHLRKRRRPSYDESDSDDYERSYKYERFEHLKTKPNEYSAQRDSYRRYSREQYQTEEDSLSRNNPHVSLYSLDRERRIHSNTSSYHNPYSSFGPEQYNANRYFYDKKMIESTNRPLRHFSTSENFSHSDRPPHLIRRSVEYDNYNDNSTKYYEVQSFRSSKGYDDDSADRNNLSKDRSAERLRRANLNDHDDCSTYVNKKIHTDDKDDKNTCNVTSIEEPLQNRRRSSDEDKNTKIVALPKDQPPQTHSSTEENSRGDKIKSTHPSEVVPIKRLRRSEKDDHDNSIEFNVENIASSKDRSGQNRRSEEHDKDENMKKANLPKEPSMQSLLSIEECDGNEGNKSADKNFRSQENDHSDQTKKSRKSRSSSKDISISREKSRDNCDKCCDKDIVSSEDCLSKTLRRSEEQDQDDKTKGVHKIRSAESRLKLAENKDDCKVKHSDKDIRSSKDRPTNVSRRYEGYDKITKERSSHNIRYSEKYESSKYSKKYISSSKDRTGSRPQEKNDNTKHIYKKVNSSSNKITREEQTAYKALKELIKNKFEQTKAEIRKSIRENVKKIENSKLKKTCNSTESKASTTKNEQNHKLISETNRSSIKSVVQIQNSTDLSDKSHEKHRPSNLFDKSCDQFDLRSKLSRKISNKNYSIQQDQTSESTTGNREKLLVTVANDCKEDDANIVLDDKQPVSLEENIKKGKTKKFKKFKLVINVICDESDASDADECTGEDTKIKSNTEDLSFLDDLNIDEIVSSLLDENKESVVSTYNNKISISAKECHDPSKTDTNSNELEDYILISDDDSNASTVHLDELGETQDMGLDFDVKTIDKTCTTNKSFQNECENNSEHAESSEINLGQKDVANITLHKIKQEVIEEETEHNGTKVYLKACNENPLQKNFDRATKSIASPIPPLEIKQEPKNDLHCMTATSTLEQLKESVELSNKNVYKTTNTFKESAEIIFKSEPLEKTRENDLDFFDKDTITDSQKHHNNSTSTLLDISIIKAEPKNVQESKDCNETNNFTSSILNKTDQVNITEVNTKNTNSVTSVKTENMETSVVNVSDLNGNSKQNVIEDKPQEKQCLIPNKETTVILDRKNDQNPEETICRLSINNHCLNKTKEQNNIMETTMQDKVEIMKTDDKNLKDGDSYDNLSQREIEQTDEEKQLNNNFDSIAIPQDEENLNSEMKSALNDDQTSICTENNTSVISSDNLSNKSITTETECLVANQQSSDPILTLITQNVAMTMTAKASVNSTSASLIENTLKTNVSGDSINIQTNKTLEKTNSFTTEAGVTIKTKSDVLNIKDTLVKSKDLIVSSTPDKKGEVLKENTEHTHCEKTVDKNSDVNKTNCEQNTSSVAKKDHVLNKDTVNQNNANNSKSHSPIRVATPSTNVKTSPTPCIINTDGILTENEKQFAVNLEHRMSEYLKDSYKVTVMIHRGRYSKIFKCRNSKGDECVVKVMREKWDRFFKGLMKEDMLKLLQRDIPNENLHLIRVFDGFFMSGQFSFVMEYYPKNLTEALEESDKPFHIDLIQSLSRQLVGAVTVLRNQNIVHSDIKPAHILLNSSNDRLKLCGFDEAYHMNIHKNVIPDIGTINYRAPEIILGHSAGFPIDVWSIAVVMFEMATKQQLFPGQFNNDILFKQLCTCGYVPYEMVVHSKFAYKHFQGMDFIRRSGVKGQVTSLKPACTFIKNCKLKGTIYHAYNTNWDHVSSNFVKKQNSKKVFQFCQLLERMLEMNPNRRLPIEYAYAHNFLLEVSSD